MIWKKRGAQNLLSNQRFIHLKNVLARSLDSLITNYMKPCILKNTSIFQIGGIPGHSMEEFILVFKTVLARAEEEGNGMIFTSMDIKSFFDKEDIYDCLETLENIGVDKNL